MQTPSIPRMWFALVPHALQEDQPLIYMWEVHDTTGALVGRYVGKAKAGARRPLRHYARNVGNILAGRPYRRGNPEGYRKVHKVLADAARSGHTIRLVFLCNVGADEDINALERAWIRLQGCRGPEAWQLNG